MRTEDIENVKQAIGETHIGSSADRYNIKNHLTNHESIKEVNELDIYEQPIDNAFTYQVVFSKKSDLQGAKNILNNFKKSYEKVDIIDEISNLPEPDETTLYIAVYQSDRTYY